MLNKLKHITALLLLVIFPISAIGMNISIHKCMMKSKTKVSLNYSSPKSTESTSCCCSSENKNQTNYKKSSCCSKSKKQKSHKRFSSSNNSKKVETTSSCCAKQKKETAQKSENSQKSDDYSKSDNFLGSNHIKQSCCSNSSFNYYVNVVVIALESSKGLQDFPILSTVAYKQINFDLTDYNSSLYKEIHFPLKEPVFDIISFIHFTSSTGDDSDVPNPLFC